MLAWGVIVVNLRPHGLAKADDEVAGGTAAGAIHCRPTLQSGCRRRAPPVRIARGRGRSRGTHSGARRRRSGAFREAVERELERIPQVSGPGQSPDQIYLTPAPRPPPHQGGGRGEGAQGRVRQRRAPAARDARGPGARRRALRSSRPRLARSSSRRCTSVRGNQRVTSQNPEATYEALEKYGRDLTKLAAPESSIR